MNKKMEKLISVLLFIVIFITVSIVLGSNTYCIFNFKPKIGGIND